MKLDQIDLIALQIPQALLDRTHDVVVRKTLLQSESPGAPATYNSSAEPWSRSKPSRARSSPTSLSLCPSPYTSAVSISSPQLERPPQRRSRFVVVAAPPQHPADAPRAVPDLADFDSRSPQWPITHPSIIEGYESGGFTRKKGTEHSVPNPQCLQPPIPVCSGQSDRSPFFGGFERKTGTEYSVPDPQSLNRRYPPTVDRAVCPRFSFKPAQGASPAPPNPPSHHSLRRPNPPLYERRHLAARR